MEEYIKSVISESKLTCSVEEFIKHMDSIQNEELILTPFNFKQCLFDEPYKEKLQTNNTNNQNAVYYILIFKNMTILQPHKPNVSGFEPILSDEAENIAKEQYTTLLNNDLLIQKINKTVEYFKSNIPEYSI